MEYKFNVAKDVIELISDYNGFVYGNFVKDVIAPRIDDPKCEISFNNINFCFNDLANKNLAIDKLKVNFRYETDNENYLTKYKILDINNKLLFCVVFVISQDTPDKNFDVNFVKFQYSKSIFQCVAFEHLIDKIRNKQTTIVKSYIPNEIHEFEKINKDFFEKGWTVSSKNEQIALSKWIVKNDIHVLINFENGHWNYCPTNKFEYGLDIAKKIIGIASLCNGYVHGEFVRDVIIPKMNNPECEISFDNIDIWFKNLTRRDLFLNKLNIFFSSAYNVAYYMNSEDQYKYHINGKSVNINIIISENFLGKHFDINFVLFKYLGGEFVYNNFYFSDRIKNKQTIMRNEYNPTSDVCFNKIYRDFFQKGWTVLSKNKQTELTKWIIQGQGNIPVSISFEDDYWTFSPNKITSKDEASKDFIGIKICCDSKDEASKDFIYTKICCDSKNDDKIELVYTKICCDSKNDDKIELRWSIENAEKHALNKTFIRVGAPNISNRLLLGAPRAWNNPNSEENMVIFILPLRITGTPENIKKALKLAQPPYGEEEINSYIKDAITKDNYQTTKSEEYITEIDAYKKMKTELKNKDININKPKNNTTTKESKNNITIEEPKDDKSKDVLMAIFNTGLEVLGRKLYNNIEDTELQYIYKCGLDEYRNKFNHVLENYNKK